MDQHLISPLPIDAALPQLLAALREAPSAVLEAPTGAGKTTRVPPAILEAGLVDNAPGGNHRVLVLEPRRVATRAAARRIAEERGWSLGEEVGYQVRFERRAIAATRLLFVTEGILVQRLQADPFLEGIGAVVFDEIHERALTADLALAMARKVQREVRPDLKLLAMSATLDATQLAEYLGTVGQPCPVVRSEGRLFPVRIEYDARPDDRPLPNRVSMAVRRALAESEGDVLVFLPGVGEIRGCATALESLAATESLAVLPLHGNLPPREQDAALRPASAHGSQRKVVLATNVAETSLTIDGVTAVVDSGLARILRYDPGCALDRLELSRISVASAKQRAGRAGRQAPGLCLRLWTEHDQRSLPQRNEAEIRRVDFSAPALQLLAWGENDLRTFPWLESPDPTRIEQAESLLQALGALDRTGVTRLGKALARLPAPPRLGRLLIEGTRLGHPKMASLAAALLAERDPFERRRGKPARPARSDLLERIDRLRAFERGRHAGSGLRAGAARQVLKARDQLLRLVDRRRLSPNNAAKPAVDEEEALLRSLLAAFPDRLARRREPGSDRGVMVGGRGVRLVEESAVREAELFLCLSMDAGRRAERSEGLVRLASAVDPAWLPEERIVDEVEVAFDEERGRVIGVRRRLFDDLAIEESEAPVTDREAASTALAKAASQRLEKALPLDNQEVDGFLTRVRSLAGWMPELELPRFEEGELIELLPLLCSGKRSFDELRRAPLLEVLRGSLNHAQQQALARHAPERWKLPSGGSARIEYRLDEPPILAARIQELFGLTETPRLAAGRIPVLLHLLAPNRRPQQVTDDLASFWANTYPQVRKELRGRYPKHAWPEDPWTAQPERRPRRRR